jgi:hypothetical protein
MFEYFKTEIDPKAEAMEDTVNMPGYEVTCHDMFNAITSVHSDT